MMLLRKILLIIILLINLAGFSQTRRFTHLTSENGISQSEIYSFLKDSRGFVWFGTIDGLNRYDGYSIEVFNTNTDNPHSLSNNTIRTMVEDHLGRIWIGTNNGLNVYNPKTELFNHININKANKQKLIVWSLLVYNGYLVIGTNNGLWRVAVQTNDLEKIESEIQQVQNLVNLNSIRKIIPSKKGGICLLSNARFARIELQNGSKEALIIDDFSLNELSPFVDIVEDFTGNLWLASPKNGLLRYNSETKEFRYFNKYGTNYSPSSLRCSALALDKNGNLWVGTLDNGLNFIHYGDLHKEKVLFESVQRKPFNSNGLNSNLIYSLYVSEDNLLWIGTIGSGVNIFDPNQKKFIHYKFRDLTNEAPNSDFVRSVFVDDRDRIWIGGHNNGLFIYDRTNNTFQKYGFDTQSIFYIANYKQNKHLICSSSGIYLTEWYNKELKIHSSYKDNDKAVFHVVGCESDIYWIATIGGLVRAKIVNDKIVFGEIYTTSSIPNLSHNNCRVLLYDEIENKLFAGTEGGGLNVISLNKDYYPQQIEVYQNTNDSNSIGNNYIRSIIKDKHQNIWVGTYEGLNKIIRDETSGKISFVSYTTKNGLPNNMIQSMVEDNYNSLWIGTNGGLSQFIAEEEKFINYTTSDGIQSNEFSEHAAYKKPDGEIIMGGINGINAFYPEQIEISSQKPQTTITEFYLFNEKVNPLKKTGKNVLLKKSIVLTDSIRFLPGQNNIGFDFSAMVYPNAEKVQYAYMLEGFDKDWQYTNAYNRNAKYTNLKHGNYVFKIKSTNNDGVWDEKSREIFIKIETPFALTWMAFIIYGLLIFSVFLYFSYFSVIRYATKKRLFLEQEHNHKVHELDEMRTRFFINISHDLRTPLTLISGPINNMLQSKNRSKEDKEKLQLIKRNVKRLSYLVEQLLDVRKSESGKLVPKLKSEDIISFTREEASHFTFALKQKELELKITNSIEKLIIGYDPIMISKVYFNIISNAIKFTDKGKIEINIEKVNKNDYELLKDATVGSFVKIEVKDTGKGMSAEQRAKVFERYYQSQNQMNSGYGIGLSHTKELIAAHHGYIYLESEEEGGTKVCFFLPDVQIINEPNKINNNSVEDIFYDSELIPIEGKKQEQNNLHTILIVEDNADMRNYIASELKEEYNTLVANNGISGLKEIENKPPELIISDIMMPNMDGLEFCMKIKTNIKTSHIPVILLTAKTDDKTKYDSLETGADAYIAKPFDMVYLKKRIKNLLHSRELLRKHFQGSITLDPSSVTVNSIDEKFLSSLLEAIEEGIPEPDFSVRTLESKMGMSHANFYRKIKSLTGQSGQELLQSMRLKRAHQIISENAGIRVNEVAYMVGFKNPNYFGKCFKKMFGMTPSEFEK